MTDNDGFERKIRDSLDRQPIGETEKAALRATRRRLLHEPPGGYRRYALPALATACSLVLLASIALVERNSELELPLAPSDDLALIVAEDEWELYQEFEFYVWYDELDDV